MLAHSYCQGVREANWGGVGLLFYVLYPLDCVGSLVTSQYSSLPLQWRASCLLISFPPGRHAHREDDNSFCPLKLVAGDRLCGPGLLSRL